MKRLTIVTGVLSLAAPFALAQTSTWVSDQDHSEVDFSITHMSISKVHGRFGNIAASFHYDPSDVTKSTVQATIDINTVDTGVEARDKDLKSPGYFDAASFPKATFMSTSVSKSGNNLAIAGNLTLHGVTKPVVLDVVGPIGPITDQHQKTHSGFSATATIDRTAFGIAPHTPAAALGDEIKLTIEIDAVKQ